MRDILLRGRRKTGIESSQLEVDDFVGKTEVEQAGALGFESKAAGSGRVDVQDPHPWAAEQRFPAKACGKSDR